MERADIVDESESGQAEEGVQEPEGGVSASPTRAKGAKRRNREKNGVWQKAPLQRKGAAKRSSSCMMHVTGQVR